MEVVQGPGDEPGRPEFYLVRRQALITGRELNRGVGQNNEPTILFSLNPPGAERFKRETGRSVGRRLAIILDGSVVSAPVIQGPIASEGQISGRFTVQEADDLAKILRAGALPVTVKVLQVSMPQGRSR